MEDKINNEVLCILRYKEDSKEIILDYEPIESFFKEEAQTLDNLCNNEKYSISDILNYIKKNPKFNQLNGHYKYCTKLDGTYQGFSVNVDEELLRIKETELILFQNKKDNPETFNFEEEIINIKDNIINKFELWFKAYDINKAYRKCYDSEKILTFSHRINGWSNPEYKLNDNFSIEVKTNFGYGNSSYFYIKVRYKNIDITPISEWINYEIAKFSEIIRYSKSFAIRVYVGTYNGKRIFKPIIENCRWKDAMEYTKDACNCSQKSEIEFIEKYVIEECEKMVSGLEDIMNKSNFTFIGEKDSHYQVDKNGHYLIEFRGEKVSGALDFISKIIEYNKIAQINSFILRVETVNKEIQPILLNEAKLICDKLIKLNEELRILNPTYLKLQKENSDYNKKKELLKLDLIKNDIFTVSKVDLTFLNLKFNELYPEYSNFEQEFKRVYFEYKALKEKIINLEKVKKNIIVYENKINEYFKTNNRA
ncbi:MAG: hypothetical protein JW783_03240 [Bacteroidales bacterium]|nr:hypothetical protein [Bacteroidales bacterium]MBN2751001.1 hypothetical protein [Bacteroidales bacterium]